MRIVRVVEFEGVAPAGEQFARGLVGIGPGSRLEIPALEAAISRLRSTGRFLEVRYRLVDEEEGVRVVFQLHERPVISTIRFEGNRELRDGELRKHVPLEQGQPVDVIAVREGREAIMELYHARGFQDVEITFNASRLERTGELVYTIREGRLIRIRKIIFEAATAFDDRELLRQIDTKPKRWIIRSGAFEAERAESDVAHLRTFYRDHGYLDATTRYRIEPNEKGKDFSIIFTIDEGTRYLIEDIEFRGSTVFSHEQLQTMMTSRAGETVRRRQVDQDGAAIRKRYGELGYIYANVQVVQVFSIAPGLVRLSIEIHEGEQIRVGRVVVRGNTRTKDKVVRRALNLFPPDDLFDLTEAREAQRRLLETRIFRSARVYPVGDAPGVRHVVIDVEEAEKAGDFIFGAGVTSNSGLVGNIVLDLKNFDITDRPRSWAELFKLRAFFGGGQRFRLELQPGTVVSRFRLDFTEPYLFDKPIRLDVNAYQFSRRRDGYDERRGGAAVSFGKRFERGSLRGWTGELAFRAESVKVEDIELFSAKEIKEQEGSSLETSIKVSLVRDRTDNRMVPTSGDRLRLSYEQYGVFGGDEIYGKLRTGITWFKTLDTDLRGRKRVLQLKAEGGVIVGDAPVFNRFFAGGTGSIRGFEFRGVGERNGLADTNIGGDFMWLAGAEYTFPLISKQVRGLVFLDMGMVGAGPVRASIGIGARLTIDLLGPVPLEFTIAVPVSSDEEDETRAFSFQIGSLF